MGRQKLKVANNTVYLGATLKIMERCETEKIRIQAIGNKTRSGIGKCLTKKLNMKIDIIFVFYSLQ